MPGATGSEGQRGQTLRVGLGLGSCAAPLSAAPSAPSWRRAGCAVPTVTATCPSCCSGGRSQAGPLSRGPQRPSPQSHGTVGDDDTCPMVTPSLVAREVPPWAPGPEWQTRTRTRTRRETEGTRPGHRLARQGQGRQRVRQSRAAGGPRVRRGGVRAASAGAAGPGCKDRGSGSRRPAPLSRDARAASRP